MAIKKAEMLRKKALEEWKEFQRKLDKQFKKGMESSTYTSELRDAIENANKAAHNSYLTICHLNNAKSDAASEECSKTQEALSEKHNHDSELYSQGKITEEEYMNRRKEYEEAHAQAYQQYKEIKASNDAASDQAYKEYKQIYDSNINNGKTVQEAQMKHSCDLTSPHGSEQDPVAKVGVSLEKISETTQESDKTQLEPIEESIQSFSKK